MKLKKILAMITVLAVIFSMSAVMTASVGAAAPYKAPTYDRKIGAWTVNDFRRVEGDFDNCVGIYPYTVVADDLNPKNSVQLLMHPDYQYADIGGFRASFDFGGIDADALAELPNMCLITQHDVRSWEAHKFHVSPEAKEKCSFTDFCNDKCAYDDNLVAVVNAPAPGRVFDGEQMANTYLLVTLTCDWDDPDLNTKGSATVQLLDKAGKVIPLYVFCEKCDGPCQCPCPGGCGVKGIGCKCACEVCGEISCICPCDKCGKEPCECPCQICDKFPCECGVLEPPTVVVETPTDDTDVDTDVGSDGTDNPLAPGANGNPNTGVSLVVLPALLAGAVGLGFSRKRK